jgi:hypothetical protein
LDAASIKVSTRFTATSATLQTNTTTAVLIAETTNPTTAAQTEATTYPIEIFDCFKINYKDLKGFEFIIKLTLKMYTLVKN